MIYLTWFVMLATGFLWGWFLGCFESIPEWLRILVLILGSTIIYFTFEYGSLR